MQTSAQIQSVDQEWLAEVNLQNQIRLLDIARSNHGRMSFRGNIHRGAYRGRIIRSTVKDGVRHDLHATKGWRTRRIAAA